MGKGIKVPCVRCYNTDATVWLSLDDDRTFRCSECEEEFTCGDVREWLEETASAWGRMLAWVEQYPHEPDAGEAVAHKPECETFRK